MDTTNIIIQALVMSKLDCCNSLLAGTATMHTEYGMQSNN